jgi:hypothetical protein
MRTIMVAALLFGLAFGGTYFVIQAAPRSAEEAATQAAVKDAILSGLSQSSPGRDGREEEQSVRELLRTFKASFYKMNQSCSAESRRAYAAAFVALVERIERANGRDEPLGVDLDMNQTMGQFLDAVGRGVITASDIPSRRLRGVASAKRIEPSPFAAELGLRDEEGDPVPTTRCKPLSEEG